MYGISGTGETAKTGDNAADAECSGDAHNSREHEGLTHERQGNKPKLLPTVTNSVHRRSFIICTVDALETCDKGKEGGAQTGPENNHNTKRHHIVGVGKPKNRRIYYSEL